MKKSIAILLMLILVISCVFFGCSKKEETDNQETTQSQQQQDVNALEQELSKQPLVVLTTNYLKKGDPANTFQNDVVSAYIMNSSEKNVTYAVVAFAAWNDKDEPVLIKSKSGDDGEYVVRISYMNLNVPKGNIFGDSTVLNVFNDASDNISIIKAIPVSCVFDDATNWVNPLYEDFCAAYEGKEYVAPETESNQETVTTEKQEETTSSSQSGTKDETETTAANNNQNSENGNNSQNTGDGNQNSASASGTQNSGGSAPQAQSYNVNKCKTIFESGAYKMTVTTDKGTADEATFTMAVKNGSIYMATTMDDIEATMLYNASKDTTYMLFDSLKMYCDVTEDMMGDGMDMSELTKDFKINIPGEITVSKENFEGTAVTCESFVDSNGVTNKYYFDASGTLVGRDDCDSDGTVSRMVISGFTGNVDDSTFEIPKGYNYVNIGWLMALMG